jgi:hypothetical protein
VNDDLFQDPRARRWIASHYVAFVAWSTIISLMALLGMDIVFVFALGLVIAVVVSWLPSPSRAWWGPGPSQVMADPRALRRYRLRTGVALVVSLALVPLVVVVAVGLLGLLAA